MDMCTVMCSHILINDLENTFSQINCFGIMVKWSVRPHNDDVLIVLYLASVLWIFVYFAVFWIMRPRSPGNQRSTDCWNIRHVTGNISLICSSHFISCFNGFLPIKTCCFPLMNVNWKCEVLNGIIKSKWLLMVNAKKVNCQSKITSSEYG